MAFPCFCPITKVFFKVSQKFQKFDGKIHFDEIKYRSKYTLGENSIKSIGCSFILVIKIDVQPFCLMITLIALPPRTNVNYVTLLRLK